MSFLIDGYNLLHYTRVLPAKLGPGGLERARLALLGMLRGALGAQASQATVVFDAAHAVPGATEVQNYHGIEVRFAIHQEQADDLLEELIRKASVPGKLTVVSDDHRIQKAAQRRRCRVLGCGPFLDWLDRQRQRQPPPRTDASDKPAGSGREETQHWLREFADLENDPDFKEAFDPFDFGTGSEPEG